MKYFLLIILTLATTPLFTYAQAQYVPLVEGIPGVEEGNMEQYINALLVLAISIGALLAVIKIIFGGVKYMLSDVITDKGDAKKDIRGALLGLLIVLAAVLVLNTINPQLTNFELFNENKFGMLHQKEGAIKVSCVETEETNCESIYSGPEGCPDGETLARELTDTGIKGSCIPIEESNIKDKLPTEEDVPEGSSMKEIILDIPCAVPGGCTVTTNNSGGVASARSTCETYGNGDGVFVPTDLNSGICRYTVDD